jgi:hypothetical protein
VSSPSSIAGVRGGLDPDRDPAAAQDLGREQRATAEAD